MSVCYYEPFYDFESILDNALSAHLGSNVSNDKAVQRRTRARINGDPTTKILKPRYVLLGYVNVEYLSHSLDSKEWTW
jgi:hypothetical protein